MAFRIELLFVGDAPEDELARARILAGSDVEAAIAELSRALDAAGLPHKVEARTVRPGKRPAASGRPRLAAAE